MPRQPLHAIVRNPKRHEVYAHFRDALMVVLSEVAEIPSGGEVPVDDLADRLLAVLDAPDAPTVPDPSPAETLGQYAARRREIGILVVMDYENTDRTTAEQLWDEWTGEQRAAYVRKFANA